MRNLLIASIATAALLSAAGARAEAVGHLGANYSHSDVDVAGFDANADVFQAEGAAAR